MDFISEDARVQEDAAGVDLPDLLYDAAQFPNYKLPNAHLVL